MKKREKYEAGAATPDGAFYFGCYVEGVTKWSCADCPKKLHKVCQNDYASVEERAAFCRDDLRVEFTKAIVAGLYADPNVTGIDPVKICDEAERIADEIIRREKTDAEERKQAEDKPRMNNIASCNSIPQKCPACIPVVED